MQHCFGQPQFKTTRLPRKAILAYVIAITALYSSGAVQAQPGELGAYSGTIKVTGTGVDSKVLYRASVKVNLPITQRDGSSVTAEFLAGEAPNATALISQWDESHKEKHADSGGQFNSWTCSLAAPVEIPMTTTGVLNVDLKAKTHALSITLLSTQDIAFNCTHSRSGAYKKKQGVVLYIGTGVPGMHYETQLPFSDRRAHV